MADEGWHIPDLNFHPPGFVPGHAGGAPIGEAVLLRFLSAPYAGGIMDSDGCATYHWHQVQLEFTQANYRFLQLFGLIFFGAGPENIYVRAVPPANIENPGLYSRGSPECQLTFREPDAFRAAALRIRPYVQRRCADAACCLPACCHYHENTLLLESGSTAQLFSKALVVAGAGLWRSMQTSSSWAPWRRAT